MLKIPCDSVQWSALVSPGNMKWISVKVSQFDTFNGLYVPGDETRVYYYDGKDSHAKEIIVPCKCCGK